MSRRRAAFVCCNRSHLEVRLRTSIVAKANRVMASAFLLALVKAVPCKIHTILTDLRLHFRYPPRPTPTAPTATGMTHMFGMRCRENGIEHRFTKLSHPWTNGQSWPPRRRGSSG